MQVVRVEDVTDSATDVTCPMCRTIMTARSSGNKASRAIKLGKGSGIFRQSSIPPESSEDEG